MPSPVIDLSHHNPSPNWSSLKSSGVVGVILKCTQGTGYLDPTFSQRRMDAKSAGLLVNSYHFLEAGNPTGQMDWYLNKLGPALGERVVIDHEDNGSKPCATLDDLCKAVRYLQARRPDVQITIYSGHNIKEQLGSNGQRSELDDTALWIAQYTSAASPSWPKQQWPAWSLWQWTDKETVAGISAPVDGNRWNGSPENLIKWMSPASDQPQPSPPPPPPPEPEEPAVGLYISAVKTKVAVYINGRCVYEGEEE